MHIKRLNNMNTWRRSRDVCDGCKKEYDGQREVMDVMEEVEKWTEDGETDGHSKNCSRRLMHCQSGFVNGHLLSLAVPVAPT